MTSVELLTFSMRTEAPKNGADWFRIVEAKKASEPTKVYIYDEIGMWGTSAKDFAAQLGDITSSEIELHLNSPGGSVFDGLAIMAALRDHKATVTAKVDGMAASAASFILQAADVRHISRNAQVMIHDAKAFVGGNAAQVRKGAELLDRLSNEIADIYAVRSGQGTTESWRALMVAGDEWYNGNEALEAGLVDAVTDNPAEEDQPEEASNSWSSEEVEAFLKTSPHKLAASAKHFSVTNRVEEAPTMTGPNPSTTKQTPAPPAVPQPPAAPAAPQASVTPAPVQQTTTEVPASVAAFVVVNDGATQIDMQALGQHVAGLEAFRKETVEGGRKDFVAKLAKDGKILANAESVSTTEAFALSLSPDQFKAWKASMDTAQTNGLFQQHGATPGDTGAPQNGGAASTEDAEQIKIYQETVDSHRAAGMDEEKLKTKDSYIKLQALLAKTAVKP